MTGCSNTPELSDTDQRALQELATIATRDSAVENEGESSVDRVECWLPSANKFDSSGFRVLCRVHYDQAGTERYRDMICIGDLAHDPVAEYCDRWAYYSDMPSFEDQPSYIAA